MGEALIDDSLNVSVEQPQAPFTDDHKKFMTDNASSNSKQRKGLLESFVIYESDRSALDALLNGDAESD